ncbi:hypothetical protein BU26DRAFT_572823 [Trematosphaeria pertusa]|uniref:F-box domain-containing protein n=1 Tax=Trematosphaeria pertusa TaxID=390896 RepID=A0A6A6HQZ0_9PLEO|nr:uncharacterized protein BU26DRAFT_572823 [Trematosphaeria pertusa]KAF2240441.1 hypothetical protein BU26DRAFT_572823 [Trematosphaeria pertusa]
MFAIGELLEHILRHVPGKDLLRLQRVCKRWRNTIRLRSFRPLLWIEPVLSAEGDPHFIAPNVPQGSVYPARLRLVQKEFFDSWHDYEDSLIYLNRRSRMSKELEESVIEKGKWSVPSLQSICSACGCCHGHFRLNNMHPLLHWLLTSSALTVCISGYGTHVHISICERRLPSLENSHVVHDSQALALSHLVIDTYNRMERHARGNDMFLNPICTQVLVSFYDKSEVEWAKEPLRVRRVVLLLGRVCSRFLSQSSIEGKESERQAALEELSGLPQSWPRVWVGRQVAN